MGAGDTAREASILVVDDEASITELVGDWLETAGYRVMSAADGKGGLREFFRNRPDLAIIDILMPNMGGVELAHLIREVSDIPVLMLSAKAHERDKVEALESGADDYVVKPAARGELLARVAAALRRAAAGRQPEPEPSYQDGAVTVDFSRHEVCVDGEPVALTNLEYRLLTRLVRQAGQVLTYTELADWAWGREYDSADYVKWHVGRLRRKIERDPANPVRIVTLRGVGYRYDPPGRLALARATA